MQLWEIILPLKDNRGASYQLAHTAFQAHLAARYGGYTHSAVEGAWSDGNTLYEDASVSYRILCEEAPSLDRAWTLFPDQLALYRARIGEGEVIERPN